MILCVYVWLLGLLKLWNLRRWKLQDWRLLSPLYYNLSRHFLYTMSPTNHIIVCFSTNTTIHYNYKCLLSTQYIIKNVHGYHLQPSSILACSSAISVDSMPLAQPDYILSLVVSPSLSEVSLGCFYLLLALSLYLLGLSLNLVCLD